MKLCDRADELVKTIVVIFKRLSRLTLSKFSKFYIVGVETANLLVRFFCGWLATNIMSVVTLFAQKPH